MQKAANAAGTTLSSITTLSMPSKTLLDLERDGALRSLARPIRGQVDDDASALELGAHHQQQLPLANALLYQLQPSRHRLPSCRKYWQCSKHNK
jgi:hypothetical protein